MPNKTEEYLALAQRTANGLTRYWEHWTDYLTTASRLYKYNFADQLMIYAQRPDATACASFDIWNNRMNRYVRRGSKGIALLDQSSSVPRLHYVFDVSDTGVRRNSRDPEVWQLNDDLFQPVSEMLAREYGIHHERLSQQIADIAGKLAESYWDNNSSDIIGIVDGSFLMDYDDAGQELQFKSAAAISIMYTILERCGFEPEGYFDRDDFQAIYDFSTPDAVYALGTAVSDCSRDVLRNIERTVKTTIRRRNVERSQHEYEEQERDLLDRRGLPAPEPDLEPAAEAAGQIRQDAPDVPDGTSPGAVQLDAADREAASTSARSGTGSGESETADDDRTAEAEPSPGQSKESTGVGAAHEQPESTGGRSDPDGTDLQLSFFNLSIPTEAQQIEAIDRAENEKSSSAFSLSQAEIEHELQHGSNFQDSKQRIIELYENQSNRKLRARALAKEYGIGGRSHNYLDGSSGFVNHDGKGLEFVHYPDYQKITLSWTQAEKYIDLMIHSDRYLTDKEKEQRTARQEAERQLPILDGTVAAEYTALKEQYPNTLVGFELNGNYLFYDKDAVAVERILHTNLLSQENVLGKVKVTGFPSEQWAAESKKLWAAGNNVYLAGLNEDGSHHQTKYLREADYLPIGSIIKLDDRGFRVEHVNFTFKSVSLQDMELTKNGLPIFRNEHLPHIRELYEEQQDAAIDLVPEKEVSYKVGDEVVVDLPTRTIEGTVGYIGDTDVRIDTSAHGQSWDNEVINKQQFEEGLRQEEPDVPELTDEELDELPISAVVDGTVQTFPDAAALDEAINAEPTPEPAGNFRITDEHLGEGGAKQKYARNIEAIKTLFCLEEERRGATAEEQEVLAQYVGWGGLADAFDPNKDNWAKEYTELKGLLSEDEYAAARSSVLNAHYTSPTVIHAIYDAVEQTGFKSGNILEPSMGVGNFFGMLPDTMQDSRLYGVELDSITGRIAKKLYPQADITVAGFETTDRRDFYDLAIGNVPFGQYKVNDKAYNKLGFSIHNYFFAKAIDQVRPGGIVAFVTSRYTMDSKDSTARKHIAERANLLGAIRLPNNAFKANAGTEVVSDIIFLQKRDRPADIEPPWVQLGKTEDGFAINQYFVDNPEMILGELTTESTQYGREECTVSPVEGAVLSDQLAEAIQHIEGQYTEVEVETPDIADEETTGKVLPADPDVKNFSYAVVDGEVYYRENSIMTQIELSDTAKARVTDMVELRQIVNQLIQEQLDDYPDSAVQETQARLNDTYDAFTKKYGLLNDRRNARLFEQDSSYYLLCSLENLDENKQLKSKADMFTKRTIRPERTVTSVDTPSEALAVSMGERGRVDLPYMAELLGTPGEYGRITTELSGVIFKDPNADPTDPEAGWQMADEYLSGDVRTKLRIAQLAAETNPEFKVNVTALEKAQPKELEASEIDVRLGATWITPEIIQKFMQETFQVPYYLRRDVNVRFSPYTAEWRVQGKSALGHGDIMSTETYGTHRANAYKILEDTLNLKDVRIYDTIEDAEGKPKRVLNKNETTLAQQKQQAIKDAFANWIWQDPQRRISLVKQYNELFNSTRPREYDGSHIHFVGMNPEITLREHQRNAIAHVLYGGNTLLAHEVGAGKTFEMAASTFGETTTAIELAPEGTGYRARTRFAKFFNLPELMSMFKEVADIKTSDQLHLPVPDAKFETVVVKPSETQKAMVQELSRRAAEIHSGNVDASVDNMLCVTNDGRKIGLDVRLMNPMLPDDPNSKLNVCVRNVLKIWEEGKDQKLTQLLFCDLSTPKNDGNFNVYDDIRKKLIAAGVPENEIEFIHNADTEAKKAALFSKVRSGDVRVLLGSTAKMGAGTNVQQRLVAVHHLDVGWKPSDMTQRNGRIIRQGNMNKEVNVFNYVTEGTFDSYLFQTLENKQRFISQIMTSKSPVRSCDDVDEQALSYAEIKALCVGNPLIKEKMDLDVQVAKLKVLKADHQSQKFRLEDKLLTKFPAEIQEQTAKIAALKSDAEIAAAHPQDKENFCGMVIKGMTYDEKKTAGERLILACMELPNTEEQVVGSYRGFELSLRFDTFHNEHQALLKGTLKYPVPLGSDPHGNIVRLDNALSNFADRSTAAENELDTLRQQQAAAQVEVAKPFPQEEELAQKSARLAELNAQLDVDEKHHEPEQDEEEKEDAPRRSVLAVLEEKAEKAEPVKPFKSYLDKDGDAR